jgi:hypothetical protein
LRKWRRQFATSKLPFRVLAFFGRKLDDGRFFSDAFAAFAKGIRTMKNLNRLGLVFGVGTVAALSFSLAACGDDAAEGGTGGTGGATAGASTGGAGASTGGAGASTGGAGASTGGAGASTGGSGGKGGAGGGGAGGTSGAAGSGGKAGSGGGGAGGSSGSAGGGAGGGGGAPSADCTKWCSGANGVVAQCAGMLAPAVDSEAKCIANCTKPPAMGAMGLACWLTHLDNIVTKNESKTTHCPHASGADNNGPCNETQ